MTESLQGKYTKEALEDLIGTDDFWYDLTVGGYIKPRKILNDEAKIVELENAINLLTEWRDELENDSIIYDL